MASPHCSFVVATYKQAHYLPISLRSLLNQTYSNYEVIVVPVQGDSETFKVLRDFKEQVRIFISPRADYIYQRNLGISQAEGRWISLFDSDDYALPAKLSSDLEVAQEEKALIVYSAFFVADENLNIKQLVVPPRFSRERLLKSCIITDFSLVNHQVYDEFGLFNESWSEVAMYNLWLRVAERYPHRIKLNATPTFLYRTYSNQMHRVLDREWQLKMREKVRRESLARKPI